MTFQCRVFKAGDALEADCKLPDDTRQALECLLLVVETVAMQVKVPTYDLLCDLAALEQGRVKW